MQWLVLAKKAAVGVALTIAAVLLVGMVAGVFLQVVFRYVLARPLSWAEELARFTFIWISMLGAAGAMPNILSQVVDFLTKKFPPFLQLVVEVLCRAGTLFVCVLLVVKGIELTRVVHFQTSPAMGVRMSYVYSAVPAGMVLMTVLFVIDSLAELRNRLQQER